MRLLADSTGYDRVMSQTMSRLTDFAAHASAVLGRTAIELAANYERAGIAFEVMTGDFAKGQKVLQDVTKLALETPFSADQLIKSAKQVKAFGFETNDVIPILSRLGDVSAATGTDMDRIILAFGQVRTTGRLMGQELRQFTNAGVPILENLAAVIGVSVGEVPNLVRQGRIGFDDVAKAFNRMTDAGGIFHNMMERVNKETLSGRWQNFKENVQNAARNLGLAAIEGLHLKEVLTSLSGGTGIDMDRAKAFFADVRRFLQGIAFLAGKVWQNLKDLWQAIKRARDESALWYERNKDVVDSVLNVIKYLAAAYLLVKTVTTAWWLLTVPVLAVKAAVLFLYGITSLPILTAVLAVATALAALDLGGMFDGIKDVFGSGFAQIGETFGKTWKGIKDAVAGGDFELAWKVGLKGVEVMWETLLATMHAAWVRFVGNLSVGIGDMQSNIATRISDAMIVVQRAVAKGAGDEARVKQLTEDQLNMRKELLGIQKQEEKLARDVTELRVREIMAAVQTTKARKELAELTRSADLTGRVGKDNLVPFDPEKWKGTKYDFQTSWYGKAMQAEFASTPETNPLMAAMQLEMDTRRLKDAIAAKDRGKPTLSDAEMEKTTQQIKDGKKLLNEWAKSLEVVNGAVRQSISVPLQLSADVLIAARDLQKEFYKGKDAMEAFQSQLAKLDEAFIGPTKEAFGTTKPPAAFGRLLMGGLSSTPPDNLKGVISDEQKMFGDYLAFSKLKPLDRAGGAGPAQLEGSREAQETISRSNAALITVEQQVLQTLRDQTIIQRESRDYQRQVYQALSNAKKAGIVVPKKIAGGGGEDGP